MADDALLHQIRTLMARQAALLLDAIDAMTLSPATYQQLHDGIVNAILPPAAAQELIVALDSQAQQIRNAMSALALPLEQIERLRNAVRGR